MPFLGYTPDNTFHTLSKQTITGDGGTSYTLTNPVVGSNDIEVFVNNVRQEPGVAYTATDTTIAFTSAIQSSDDVYVIYQGKAVGLNTVPDNTISTGKIVDGAVTQAKIDPNVSLGGRRNLIINGAMQVWQRGTSGLTTSGGYTADRWWMSNATSIERSTDAPEGFSYSLKVNTTNTNTSIGQPIELVTGSSSPMIAGETVTLSFYAKTATGTDDIWATIAFRDAKFSATNQAAFGDMGSTITTAWQRFTSTFTVPNINATNVLAGLEIYGIDGDIYITGVQLEVGSVATPFEHRSYGEELALCQRYYQIVGVCCYHTSAGTNHTLNANTPMKTSMRASPTMGVVSYTNSTNVSTQYPPSTVQLDKEGCMIRVIAAASGDVDYRAIWYMDAEL